MKCGECRKKAHCRGLCHRHYKLAMKAAARGERVPPSRSLHPVTPEHKLALSKMMDSVGRGETWPNQPTMAKRGEFLER